MALLGFIRCRARVSDIKDWVRGDDSVSMWFNGDFIGSEDADTEYCIHFISMVDCRAAIR